MFLDDTPASSFTIFKVFGIIYVQDWKYFKV